MGAYLIWGVLPFYLRLLQGVPAADVLAHRILWTVLVVVLLISGLKGWERVRAALRQPRLLLMLLASAVCITINWGVYTWAILAGHAIDTSLGYFINPLVSVLFGVALLGPGPLGPPLFGPPPPSPSPPPLGPRLRPPGKRRFQSGGGWRSRK